MLFAAAAVLSSVLWLDDGGLDLAPGAAAQSWALASALLGKFATRMPRCSRWRSPRPGPRRQPAPGASWAGIRDRAAPSPHASGPALGSAAVPAVGDLSQPAGLGASTASSCDVVRPHLGIDAPPCAHQRRLARRMRHRCRPQRSDRTPQAPVTRAGASSPASDPSDIFDVLEAVVAADPAAHGEDTAGVLDSTVLDDAVAAQDTVTQLIAAARRVGRHGLGAGARLHRPGQASDRQGRPGRP